MTTKGGSHEPERPSALPAMAATADLGTLVDQLMKLGLDFAAEALPAILTHAVKEDMGSPALLEQLLRGELERREERRVRTSLRLSGLPTGQTLANFDFAFQPAVQRSKLEALGTCAWLREKQGLLEPIRDGRMLSIAVSFCGEQTSLLQCTSSFFGEPHTEHPPPCRIGSFRAGWIHPGLRPLPPSKSREEYL